MKIAPLTAALAAVVLASPSRPAAAGDQDFTLVNRTGVEIHNLYVSASETDDWEEDVLGKDVLADGESVVIEFAPDEESCLYDLMVRDHEEEGVYWRKINLCTAAKVTLRCGEKGCTAEVE